MDCCAFGLDGFAVVIFEAGVEVWSYQSPPGTPPYENVIAVPVVQGDEVKISLPESSSEPLSFAEVMVMDEPISPSVNPSMAPTTRPPDGPYNVALLKSTEQSSTSENAPSSRAVDGNIEEALLIQQSYLPHGGKLI